MKFNKINGVQYIVLEENDEICVTTPNELTQNGIKIKSNDSGLEISASSSIVSSIRGEGLLDKVYIQPVVSSEEIIEKCNKWLDMFKQVHDTFKNLVLTDEYRKQDVVMYLSFPTFFGYDNDNTRGKAICLELRQHSNILNEGVSIKLDSVNEDVYSYLVASVLDYYVSQNLEGQQIDLMDDKNILYSNAKKMDEKWVTVPMLAKLYPLIDSDYYWIVNNIISNHNLGESSEQLVENLRNRISNQQIGDRMDSYINYSSNQCEYILKKNIKK